jgi:hypothetical protein
MMTWTWAERRLANKSLLAYVFSQSLRIKKTLAEESDRRDEKTFRRCKFPLLSIGLSKKNEASLRATDLIKF